MNASIAAGSTVSVKEVLNELDGNIPKQYMKDWLASNRQIFLPPCEEEAVFVASIFAVPHFQYLVTEKQRLKGSPVADPFVIASAKYRDGCVVTEESRKPNSARMPNVCDHFGIDCCNLQDFMSRSGWKY